MYKYDTATFFSSLLSMLLLLTPSLSAALESKPSFDCKKATTKVERMICSEFILGLDDSILSQKYKNALKVSDNHDELHASQLKWLKERNACATKECLKEITWERIRELENITFKSRRGKYKLSNGWPTGIHAHIFTMSEEQKETCRAIGNVLDIDKIDKPMKCGVASADRLEHNLNPKWTKIKLTEAFNIVKTMKDLREKQYGREVNWSAEAEERIRNQLTNEELIVSKANLPLSKDGKTVEVISLARGECNKNGSSNVSVKYAFTNHDGEIKLLRGLGSPNEVFLWEGRGYFISHSERSTDDSFQYHLQPPQPIIFIHSASDKNGYYGRMCRFIFWDENEKIK